jgi:hypothetical protein
VKYLFVLFLFALVAFMLYWRMRPYIRGVRRFLGVVREINRMNASAPQDLPRQQQPKHAAGEKLARCAACGTWTTASRAVTLRATGVTYCSHSCLERAAAPHKARKSAS